MDYYKLLNINKNSSQKEIKQAWRKLSMVHHPDRNNGVESELYKNVNAGYQLLSDPEKKKQYDLEKSIPSFMKNGNNPFEFINLNNANTDEMFRMFFNTAAANFPFSQERNNYKPPKKTRITQTVTMNDLFNRRSFKVPIDITKDNTHELDEVNFIVDGKVNNGDIIKTKSKNYNDVEIYIKLQHHNDFRKEGINIVYEKTIKLVESLAGFSFKFKYLDDQEYTINNNIKIIQPGYTKILKNMGLYCSGQKGSLIIIFDIEFPEILEDDVKLKLKTILN
jgi:DnaJ-class molecular chaperone